MTYRLSSLWVVLFSLICFSACSPKKSAEPESGKEPAVRSETKAQKQKEIQESFRENSRTGGSAHAQSIDRFFSDLSRATSKSDQGKVGTLFDSELFFRLMKRKNILPDQLPTSEAEFISILEQLIPKMLCDPIQGVVFERYEVRNVKFIKDDTDAVVYIRMWDAEQIQMKMRWWLHRTGDRWVAYDYEVLEASLRTSTVFGLGMKMAAEKHPAGPHLQSFMQVISLLNSGAPEEAIKMIKAMDDVPFPDQFEAIRQIVLAACLTEAGRFAEAIEAGDRAKALNQDMPIVHFLYAYNYNLLGKHTKASNAIEDYAAALGKDVEYYSEKGWSSLGLGQTDTAIEYFQKGIADDPPSASQCVIGLMRALPNDQMEVARGHYKTLARFEGSLQAPALHLVHMKDLSTLKTLVDIHRGLYPNDPDLATYDEILKEGL